MIVIMKKEATEEQVKKSRRSYRKRRIQSLDRSRNRTSSDWTKR